MILLPEDSPLPLYQQLYLQLRQEIQSGNIAAGEKLPSKRKLSEQLGVSINTNYNDMYAQHARSTEKLTYSATHDSLTGVYNRTAYDAQCRELDHADIGVLIVDARHKPSADDLAMAEFFRSSGLEFLVVPNKLDKLKKSEISPSLQQIRDTLMLENETVLIPFSAATISTYLLNSSICSCDHLDGRHLYFFTKL